jgi:E3 ubiquitin-protein ligase SHPRH
VFIMLKNGVAFRHVRAGALRVVVYEGVQKGARIVADFEHAIGISEAWTKKVVGAHDLATADLVLTTYDTLRGDLFHIPSDAHANERFSFRQTKRYRVIPTPLTRLKWWRVCLDEAQMVESVTARATEMALSLRAFHRWCVSGTPIQRGLDDLFGLLRFLGAEPFDDYRWWSLALKQPYEEGKHGAIDAMHDFFQGLMWRSTKLQVMDELALPPQEERLVWLRFSPIEAHFYRQQHERCAVKAREIIAEYRKHTGRISSEEALSHVSGLRNKSSEKPSIQNELYIDFEDRPLTHKEAAKLLNHLLRLRQACCHPQVGSAGIRSLQRSPMTMDEILEAWHCNQSLI